jgi:hypothetical protein
MSLAAPPSEASHSVTDTDSRKLVFSWPPGLSAARVRIPVVPYQAVTVDEAIENLTRLDAIGAIERRHVQPRKRATQPSPKGREPLAPIARTPPITRQTEGRT